MVSTWKENLAWLIEMKRFFQAEHAATLRTVGETGIGGVEGTAGGREVSTPEALQDRYVANTNSAKTLDHMFQQTFGFGSSRFSSALPAPPHKTRHGIGRLAQDARDLPRLGGARLVWVRASPPSCPQQYAGAARQPRAAAENRNAHHLHSGDGSPVIGSPGQRRDQF